MNEQLQLKLVEILTAIQNGAKAAGDFALEQLPGIAQQYVAYGRISSLVDVAICIALLAACAKLIPLFTKQVHSAPDMSGAEFFNGLGVVGAAVIGVFSLFGLVVATQGALLVWLAPKVWLLKELASLVK